MAKNMLLISDHGDPLAELGSEQAGGQNNYVLQLSLALEKLGYTVDVVTHWNNPESPQFEQFSDNCRVIRIAAGRKRYLAKHTMHQLLPAFYDELTSLLSIDSYDLIHTHYWLSGLLGERLQREYQVPFVHTSHSLAKAKQFGTGRLDRQRFEAECHILRSAQAVIATTQHERDLIYSFEPDSAPIHVIPCGVSEVFTRKAESSGHQPTGTTFLYAGRLVEEKGIYTLLEAFNEFMDRQEDRSTAQLIVAGGDHSSIDLTKRLPRDRKLKKALHGIRDAVQFIGPQTPEALAKLFNRATATIVPSHYESFGMVAAESLACGTPVIASRTGGLQYVVQHGETGLLAEPRDAQHLASMMSLMASSDRFSQTLGENGQRIADELYRWDTIVERIHELYTQVADRVDTKLAYH